MSDASKAVFLSYASQDAEAAKRICESLRAVGVEVWFDQNELVGGDAWDAKIRGQIGLCALFVPIISANTQARLEGYFRIEWKLAARRTHGIATAKAFLLPIVIDGTRDAEAHVPDEFREVQWTRLLGGDIPSAFCARVKNLLGGEAAVAGSNVGPVADRAPGQRPGVQPTRARSRPWLVPAAIALAAAVALAIWQPWKKAAPVVVSPVAVAADVPLSEARKLIAHAREILADGDVSNHETLLLAEELLKKAQTLDPTDGEVWAAEAQLSNGMFTVGVDRSRTRRELLKQQAERAITLSPKSIEAQIAYAGFLSQAGQAGAAEAVRRLEPLTTQYPSHRAMFEVLGMAYSRGRNPDSASTAFDRANTLPGGDANALAQKGAQMIWYGRYAEAEQALAQSIAVKETGRADVFGVLVTLCWRGDLDGAAAAVERWPAWLKLEPRGAIMASQVWLWRHEPEKAIAVLKAVASEAWSDTLFTGPKSVLLALAYEMAGQPQAAHAEWENARMVAERLIAEDSTNRSALVYKACALVRLGESAAAERILREVEQSKDLHSEFWSCAAPSALLRVLLGHGVEVAVKFDAEQRSVIVEGGHPSPRAALRLNPVFDSIRATPEFQKWMAAAPAPEEKKESKPTSAVAPVVSDKSIAVLPFANRSPDPANAFFTDGVHEDILTNLGNIRELRVVSSTSVEQYRGTTKTMKQIGAELSVAYILEGSVQRVGNKVHVTGQLIDARTDAHLWAKSFDKDLSDIFVIQAELAKAIAAELRAVLSPEEQKLVEQKLTDNPKAYDLYLEAGAERRRIGNTREARERAVRLLEAAVELDPKFATAWASLVANHGAIYGANWDHSPARLTKAKTALDKVEQLAHGTPLAISAASDFYYYTRDYVRSLEISEKMAVMLPNDGGWQNEIASTERRLSHWPQAVAASRRAVALEPESFIVSAVLVQALESGRRFGEADVEEQRWLGAHPDAWARCHWLARRAFRASGSTLEMEKIIGRVPESYANSTAGIEARKTAAFLTGNLDEYLRLDALKPNDAAADWAAGSFKGIEPTLVLLARGEMAGARARLADVAAMRTRLEAEPENDLLWAQLGEHEALLGNKEEALRCARKAVELMPETLDALRGPTRSLSLAFVYAWIGDKERAIAEYARLLRVPVSVSYVVNENGLNIHEMKRCPAYAPLRGDPRFEALLNDPKNNAPLF